MPTYDIEDLVQDIEDLLKSKLNAKVAAIEAEKVARGRVASSPAAVASDAYFQYGWNDTSLNKSPAVGIFVARSEGAGEGPFTKITHVLEVGVVLSGTQNDKTAKQKAMRYARALKEVFEENWGKLNSCVTREKIETIGPIDFTLNQDSSDECKIAGVSITATLG